MSTGSEKRPVSVWLASPPRSYLLITIPSHISSQLPKVLFVHITSNNLHFVSATAAPMWSIPSKGKGLAQYRVQLVAIFGLLASTSTYAFALISQLAKPSPCRAALDLRDLVFTFNTSEPGFYDNIDVDTRWLARYTLPNNPTWVSKNRAMLAIQDQVLPYVLSTTCVRSLV